MDAVIAYLPAILRGTSVTVAVALCSVALAVLLGLLGARGKLSASRAAQAVTSAYTTLVRGEEVRRSQASRGRRWACQRRSQTLNPRVIAYTRSM